MAATVLAATLIATLIATMESDYRDVLEIGERADVDCLVEYVTHDGETFLLPS